MQFPSEDRMDAALAFTPPLLEPRASAPRFAHWLRSHREAVAMAGLLAFAAPVTFFIGALSVMRAPTAANVTMLGLWWLFFGFELWGLLLALGYAGQRVTPALGRHAQAAAWLGCGAVAAVCVNLSTVGRAAILLEQGVVQSARTMQLYGFILSLTMALLFFAHLRRSGTHEAAAARLATAQAAQRDARRRTAQARLQAVQARIDPHLLFEMLEAVRLCYAADAPRAERLLDELVAFLRASLPRLPTCSSSVPREAELARAYARLRSLAGSTECPLVLDVHTEAMHARFPPGVLLPLLDDALRARPGRCALMVTRSAQACRVELTLPVRPSHLALERVRALLADVYGATSTLAVDDAAGPIRIKLQVPYELA
ncbi:MAG: hypothetical protein JWQ33_467 [Ramlibacter sp.]|nr:hypothetical protein [Ramlibacter sp.]